MDGGAWLRSVGRPRRSSHWRAVTDEPADRAVAAYFADRDGAEPGSLVHSLVTHLELPPEQQVPAITEFLATAGQLPDWADPARMARGQAYFGDWALHQFTALYLASLPSAYAAARGVHVLWLTARLERDPERRLNETAQFLMDVTAPDSFGPRGAAVDRILHVRLMHAAVRWLIDHDPGVARPDDADPTAPPAGPTWATSWGRPANQEDLAGTMLTFTTVVLDAFANSGVESSAAGAEDFFHLWTVIAHVLGVHDALIPRDVAEGRRLQAAIFGRQQEAIGGRTRPHGDAARAPARPRAATAGRPRPGDVAPLHRRPRRRHDRDPGRPGQRRRALAARLS